MACGSCGVVDGHKAYCYLNLRNASRCDCGHPREWHRSTWASHCVNRCHGDFLSCECTGYERAAERARLAREDLGDR